MSNKTYYDILNIPHNSNQEEIKKAYKIMAMKFHPDKNTHDTTDKFREISLAYQVLSNLDTKFEYDNNINKLPKNNYEFKRTTLTDPFVLFNNIFSIINNVQQNNEYTKTMIRTIETTLVNKLCPILINELNNINSVPQPQPTQKVYRNITKSSAFIMSDEDLNKLINNTLC